MSFNVPFGQKPKIGLRRLNYMDILIWQAWFGPSLQFKMKKPHEKYILLAAITTLLKTAFLAFASLTWTFWVIF